MNALEQMIISHWAMGQEIIFLHEIYHYIYPMIDDATREKFENYEMMIRLDRDHLLEEIKIYERILRGDESNTND